MTHLVMAQSHPGRQSLFYGQDVPQGIDLKFIECFVCRIDEQRLELVAPILDFILLEVLALGRLRTGCAR